ncbi:MAG: penicillin-binding protein 2 [Fimbriimonadaceae bacterium]
MSVIHGQRKPSVDVGVLVFPVVCGLFLLAIFLRLWYFQVVLSASLTERASVNARATVPELAPRGLIYDRAGNILAGVRPALVVTAIPYVVAQHPNVLPKVAQMLGTSAALLERNMKRALSRRLPAPVYVGASVQVGSRIAEARADLPGIGIDTQPMRYDADTIDFTHILGRVWVPSKADVDRLSKDGLAPAAYVGKDGLEWYYEPDLMGKPGTSEIEVDAKHRPVKVVGRDSPVPGTKLELSIDSDLQKLATKVLQDPHGVFKLPPGHRAAIVALDPSTGEVLCMASSPTYDLKLFQNGISKEAYQKLNSDEYHPFLNRGISGFYPPGSIFKIITSLAMQESGIFDPQTTVFCDGAFHISKRSEVKCLGHHGVISYLEALKKSCNTYFCTMGTRAGVDALAHAAREMGLGQAAGLDVFNDVRGGVIPDARYKELHKLGRWYTGDTANTAIGQGFVEVSPLQMADVAAMVANRGVMYRPHLVHAKGVSLALMQPVTPEVMHTVDAPSSFWDTLIEGLHGVIGPGGTGAGAEIPGVEWGGKTGSAEHQGKGKTHSWFVGFAPLDHPRIAIAVVVEAAGHGSDFAVPIAQTIVKAYLAPAKARLKSSSAN